MGYSSITSWHRVKTLFTDATFYASFLLSYDVVRIEHMTRNLKRKKCHGDTYDISIYYIILNNLI